MGFWQGAYQGAVIGSITGVGGVVANEIFTGQSITLKSIMGGAVIGGFVGGVVGGVQGQIAKNKITRPFKSLMKNNGLTTNDPIPLNDNFLKEAREVWFSEAPMDKVKKFTVENLSDNAKKYFAAGEADGLTSPLYEKVGNNLIATGNSNVYFNPNTAFSSAQQLYKVMGHELLHVSQIGALSGKTATYINGLRDIMEFHAYNFQSQIGAGTIGNSFDREMIGNMMQNEWFGRLSSNNFNWTFKFNFKYPFK